MPRADISSVPPTIFTPAPLIRHMCNLCEPSLSDPKHKVFEPGCGTGNFLVEILERRLQELTNPHLALISLSNLYGVDIVSEYLTTARNRLRGTMLKHFSAPNDYRFLSLIDLFLEHNLIRADLLKERENITFVDWRPISDFNFQPTTVQLSELLEVTNA